MQTAIKVGALTYLYIHLKLNVRMQLFECCIDEVLEIESANKWFVMRITVEGNANVTNV